MSIKKDLVLGSIGQDMVKKVLEKHGFIVKTKIGKFTEYDLEVSHQFLGTKTIEVKYEAYAVRSKKFAFEYWNPKLEKPSGILATESDVWCHVYPNVGIFSIKTTALKTLIHEVRPLKIIERWVDKNSSMMIYTVDSIKDRFSLLEDMTFEEILGMLT